MANTINLHCDECGVWFVKEVPGRLVKYDGSSGLCPSCKNENDKRQSYDAVADQVSIGQKVTVYVGKNGKLQKVKGTVLDMQFKYGGYLLLRTLFSDFEIPTYRIGSVESREPSEDISIY